MSASDSVSASALGVGIGPAASVAWGYVEPSEIEPGEQLLDRVAAMLHRLGAQR